MMVTMVFLGFWQLDRLHERREANDAFVARAQEPIADVRELGPEADYRSFDSAKVFEFRNATATGEYLSDQEVIVRSRTYDTSPGSWVLTPLLLDDGTVVIVNRGWIPNSGQLNEVPEEKRAPIGPVRVDGLVRMTEQRSSIGPKDPDKGVLTSLARADVGRIAQQLDAEVLPFYLQLLEQDPPITDNDPIALDPPTVDEGPHLSYSIQWFTFTTLTAIVYVLILRKKRNDLEKEADLAALELDQDG